MADVFTAELTFGPAQSGMMTPSLPSTPYRTILLRGSSVYASYALADVFTLPQYWSGGTQYTPVTALPGYSFTRSGQQGAVDASGAVQFFNANVPAINSAGFHSYGALTNILLQSQTFQTAPWSPINVSVTPNALLAPDGTTTAAKLVRTLSAISQASQSITRSTGFATQSIIAKAGEDNFVWINPNDGADNYTWFNLSNGTVGTNAVGNVPYIISLGNGYYRCVVVRNMAGSGYFVVGLSGTDGNNSTGIVSNGIYIWQAQEITGNFPNGGPLIVTTTAAASIGASSLSQSLANGTYSAAYTFDDNSTQTINPTTIAAGTYAFPGSLNRNIVKQVLIS